MSQLLRELNDEQRAAVQAVDGPVLIFAGAGSGKTRVLTYRIAYMVRELGIPPHQILAVTFTNKAAEEMIARIQQLIGNSARRLWAGTFHSVCARILRMDGERIGVPRNFVVFDEGDQLSLVKEALSRLNYDPQQFKPADVLTAISRLKNELVTPDRLRGQAKGMFEQVVRQVFRIYQRMLEENRALDFDDLLLRTVELFEKCSDVLERWQDRFRYILVDEYQDINFAQYRFLHLLAAKHRNICVVGDDDQSIYGWRGANVELILRFHEDYPDAKIFRLERNYRSTRRILECANAVISHNKRRAEKRLWTDREDGPPAVVYQAVNDEDEAEWVAELIARKIDWEDRQPGDFAILYRVNAMSRRFEEALMRRGIPYKIVGGVRFYERAEIKDVIAYLRVLHNPADNVSLRRIINRPPRGIGEKTIQAVEQTARAQGLSLLEACRAAATDGTLRPQQRQALADFVALIDELRDLAQGAKISELVKAVAERTGYLRWLRQSSRADQQMRADNVEEFVNVAREFELKHPEAGLEQFLEHLALMSDIDEAGELGNQVALMTLHSAKGLEFPIVIITGLEEGTFPHERSMGDETEIEEERRLCYVGITRAMDELYMTWAQSRMVYGERRPMKASRFLMELPEEHVVFEGRAPLMEAAAAREEMLDSSGRIDLVAMLDEASKRSAGDSVAVQAARAEPAQEQAAELQLAPGDKVRHPVFGVGTVVAVKNDGRRAEVQVAFDGRGIKRLAPEYAKLEKIE